MTCADWWLYVARKLLRHADPSERAGFWTQFLEATSPCKAEAATSVVPVLLWGLQAETCGETREILAHWTPPPGLSPESIRPLLEYWASEAAHPPSRLRARIGWQGLLALHRSGFRSPSLDACQWVAFLVDKVRDCLTRQPVPDPLLGALVHWRPLPDELPAVGNVADVWEQVTSRSAVPHRRAFAWQSLLNIWSAGGTGSDREAGQWATELLTTLAKAESRHLLYFTGWNPQHAGECPPAISEMLTRTWLGWIKSANAQSRCVAWKQLLALERSGILSAAGITLTESLVDALCTEHHCFVLQTIARRVPPAEASPDELEFWLDCWGKMFSRPDPVRQPIGGQGYLSLLRTNQPGLVEDIWPHLRKVIRTTHSETVLGVLSHWPREVPLPQDWDITWAQRLPDPSPGIAWLAQTAIWMGWGRRWTETGRVVHNSLIRETVLTLWRGLPVPEGRRPVWKRLLPEMEALKTGFAISSGRGSQPYPPLIKLPHHAIRQLLHRNTGGEAFPSLPSCPLPS